MSSHGDEQTLIIIKPDAFEHERAITALIRASGLRTNHPFLRGPIQRSLIIEHYAEHAERPYYSDLIEFMASGPAAVTIVSGENAVARMRALAGATKPEDWAEGTIRKLYGTAINRNAVHTSDSPASAAREIALFFPLLENT